MTGATFRTSVLRPFTSLAPSICATFCISVLRSFTSPDILSTKSSSIDFVLGSRHAKTWRLKSTGAGAARAVGSDVPSARSTACTIVPLYPNEDAPPTPTPTDATLPVGKTHARPRSAPPTCGLIRRSCAFGEAKRRHIADASTNSPASPAAVSACPLFAFKPPTVTGGCPSPRAESTSPASEPASIGSPSAVPVPCVSVRVTAEGDTPASDSAARSSTRCACPLGAVRLALRPS